MISPAAILLTTSWSSAWVGGSAQMQKTMCRHGSQYFDALGSKRSEILSFPLTPSTNVLDLAAATHRLWLIIFRFEVRSDLGFDKGPNWYV